MTQKYNNQIYNLYEKEVEKTKNCHKKKLRWEVEDLRCENKQLKDKLNNMDLIIENTVNKAVEKDTKPLIAEIKFLKDELNFANNEISKLKNVIKEKDRTIEKLNNTINLQNYNIDKLEGKVNKNSTNSSIPTSKEIVPRTNTYNHREESSKKKGAKFGYKGSNLSKEIISLVVMLRNYFSIPYSKIKELLKYLSNQIIDISEGTINNVYKQFSKKTEPTLDNIKKIF